MTTIQQIDERELTTDPDSIGECEICEYEIGHDEYVVWIERGYNCHGIFMSKHNDMVYHRHCFELAMQDYHAVIARFIEQHSPIEQHEVIEEFGTTSVRIIRELMSRGTISYDIDWRLQYER